MKYSLRTLMVAGYVVGMASMVVGLLALGRYPVGGLMTIVCGLLMFGTSAATAIILFGRSRHR
jgi:hypothetical protein